MTDLINRPSRAAAPGASNASAATESAARPLGVNALIAGVSAAVLTLVVAMSVALTGWFLADAGSHGDTKDALRAGADAWLVGHGSRLVLAGAPLGILPLGLTALLALAVFRFGRWAGVSAEPVEVVERPRALALATLSFTGGYVVIAVLTGVVASQAGAAPGLGRMVLGALLVSGVGAGLGLAVGTGQLSQWLAAVPEWVRALGHGAVSGVLSLFLAAALLVATSLLVHLNAAAAMLSGLHLGVGDALAYTFVIAMLAPNCVLLGAAYLLGPGFAVGTGTVVSTTAVTLGPVPAFPVLAALPASGPTPGWLIALMSVPVIAAGLGAALAQRRCAAPAYDLAALRGAGSGFLAGLGITVLIGLSGGPMGTGRMAQIGAPVGEVLVVATGAMTIGGLLGGLAMTWWLRRR